MWSVEGQDLNPRSLYLIWRTRLNEFFAMGTRKGATIFQPEPSPPASTSGFATCFATSHSYGGPAQAAQLERPQPDRCNPSPQTQRGKHEQCSTSPENYDRKLGRCGWWRVRVPDGLVFLILAA